VCSSLYSYIFYKSLSLSWLPRMGFPWPCRSVETNFPVTVQVAMVNPQTNSATKKNRGRWVDRRFQSQYQLGTYSI
jgi:hypothetical protein